MLAETRCSNLSAISWDILSVCIHLLPCQGSKSVASVTYPCGGASTVVQLLSCNVRSHKYRRPGQHSNQKSHLLLSLRTWTYYALGFRYFHNKCTCCLSNATNLLLCNCRNKQPAVSFIGVMIWPFNHAEHEEDVYTSIRTCTLWICLSVYWRKLVFFRRESFVLHIENFKKRL